MGIIEKLKAIGEAITNYQQIKRERDELAEERDEIDVLVTSIYDAINTDNPKANVSSSIAKTE